MKVDFPSLNKQQVVRSKLASMHGNRFPPLSIHPSIHLNQCATSYYKQYHYPQSPQHSSLISISHRRYLIGRVSGAANLVSR